MMQSGVNKSWVALSVLLLGLGGAASLPTQVSAADQQQITPTVGIVLTIAQQAIEKERWDEALARLRDAKAIKEKKPYDDYQIAEFESYIMLKKGDNAGAAAAYVATLNSGFVPAEKLVERLTLVTQLYYQAKDYPKVVEFGKRLMEASNELPPDTYVLVGQAQYLVKDYQGAAQAMDKAAGRAKALNQPLNESWLQIQMSSYSQMNDTNKAADTLKRLAINFPKEKYWEDLTGMMQIQAGNDQAMQVHIYQLMMELNLISRGVDYLKFGEAASKEGIPGEALKALEAGEAKSLYATEDEKKYGIKLLEQARKAAETDRKALPALEAEAKAATQGEVDYQLGVAFASYGQYDKAVEAIKRGIAKGGLKKPDEVQLLLGRSLLKANRASEAKAAFEAVPADSKLSLLAQLWAIHGQQKLPWLAAAAQ